MPVLLLVAETKIKKVSYFSHLINAVINIENILFVQLLRIFEPYLIISISNKQSIFGVTAIF